MGEIEGSGAQGEILTAARPQREIDDAIEGIMDLRKRNGKITFEEIRSAREEGR
jgi:hypothetical protein